MTAGVDDTQSVISATEIARHLDVLTGSGPRHAGSPAGVDAALRHITDELTACGLTVAVQRYGPDPAEVNLTAAIGDTRAPAVELGAHWDSVPGSPGADDNASGVAGVLAAARALTADVMAGRWRPGRPVRFCLYGDEETGFLGSSAHVRRAGARVHGAIVLEMIGYRSSEPGSQHLPPGAELVMPDLPDVGDFIAVIADAASEPYRAALARAAAEVAPDLAVRAVVVPDVLRTVVLRSDHVPYWEAGLPAVMVTDTADYRNPHYHRRTDTTATLDLGFAADVTRAVTAAVRRLAA